MEMPGFRLDGRALLFRRDLPCPAEILQRRMLSLLVTCIFRHFGLHAFAAPQIRVTLLFQSINKDTLILRFYS